MKALCVEGVGGTDVMRFNTRARPIPGPGQVRIKVACSAVVPFDVAIRSGRMQWQAPEPPFIIGTEFAGVIDFVGKGVSRDRLGERVIIRKQWGGMAEYALAQADSCLTCPNDMSLPLAMAHISSCATAWHAIHTAGTGLSPGDVLLLHSAAGPVAILAAQIAKEAGATVIGLAGSAEKVEYALSYGMDHAINYRDNPGWPGEVMALTERRGVNLVIDGVQGPDAHRSLDALAPFGQIVFLGQSAGNGPAIPIGLLIAKSARVSGMVIMHALARTGGAEIEQFREKIRSGAWRYPLNPLVPFDDAIDTYAAFENRELCGRTVIAIDPEIC